MHCDKFFTLLLTHGPQRKSFIAGDYCMSTDHQHAERGNFCLSNPNGRSAVVLVCEHASPHFPPDLGQLGLSSEAAISHAAWDPGALAVATRLSEVLDAPLAASTVSRLVYDCNRPPASPGAIIERSEKFDVPGNQSMSPADREARVNTYYAPFRDGLSDTLAARDAPCIVTIHSFTRVYLGKIRDTDIGILHDSDARLADAMLDAKSQHTDLLVRRNDPYGPEDGVTHTLLEHGIAHDRPNVMIEVRNDLIADQTTQTETADMLARWISQAFKAAGLEGTVSCSV